MTDISSSDNTAQAATAAAKKTLQQASHWSAEQWWGMVKKSFAAWVDDYAPSMGAALAYYTVFSLAPLLVIVISVAGLIFGPDAVRGALFSEINSLVGADAAVAIQDLLISVSKPSTGIIGSILGVVVLLIGATSVFGELQDALDRIWRAPARVRSSGLPTLLRTRILSFGMILGIAFLLVVSLVTSAAIAALGKWWGSWFVGWEVMAQIINAGVGFVMTTAVFALIYKLMPRVKVGWVDVWVGAVVTALLFTFGHLLISLYIGKSGVASGFGAAGSVAVIFVWVYYSAQVFLVGAEFTWVYAQCLGSRRHLARPTVQELLGAADIPQLSAELSPQTVIQASVYATAGSVMADANDAQPVARTAASNVLPLALASFAFVVALALIVRSSGSLPSAATHSKVRDAD